MSRETVGAGRASSVPASAPSPGLVVRGRQKGGERGDGVEQGPDGEEGRNPANASSAQRAMATAIWLAPVCCVGAVALECEGLVEREDLGQKRELVPNFANTAVCRLRPADFRWSPGHGRGEKGRCPSTSALDRLTCRKQLARCGKRSVLRNSWWVSSSALKSVFGTVAA